jgi:hypothetical protein
MMINSGYGAMGGFDNYTDIAGLGSVFESYMTGGGTKKKSTKKKSTKKGKRTPMRTPMRKQLSSKAKSMSKMRMRNVKKLTQRQKKLEKRLKHRKARTDVIDSLASTKSLPKELEDSMSPSMKKFVSKIPRDSSSSAALSSWPSLDLDQPHPIAHKKTISTKSFGDARKKLADILMKNPVYPVKSKSVIKFSDYKSKLTPKEKAALKAKSKKKGRSR